MACEPSSREALKDEFPRRPRRAVHLVPFSAYGTWTSMPQLRLPLSKLTSIASDQDQPDSWSRLPGGAFRSYVLLPLLISSAVGDDEAPSGALSQRLLATTMATPKMTLQHPNSRLRRL